MKVSSSPTVGALLKLQAGRKELSNRRTPSYSRRPCKIEARALVSSYPSPPGKLGPLLSLRPPEILHCFSNTLQKKCRFCFLDCPLFKSSEKQQATKRVQNTLPCHHQAAGLPMALKFLFIHMYEINEF